MDNAAFGTMLRQLWTILVKARVHKDVLKNQSPRCCSKRSRRYDSSKTWPVIINKYKGPSGKGPSLLGAEFVGPSWLGADLVRGRVG